MHSSVTSSTEHIPFDDDKQSTVSQDVPRAEHALEALQLVAGNRVRHARCPPEFLEEVAGVHLKKFTTKKFKIIAGSEAKSYFENYISEHKNNNKGIPSPIIFAVTVWESGTKCVDYYMTWRGKTKPRHCKDFESRIDQLDSDFRQLAKSLDKEFKRISSLKTCINVSTSRRVEKRTRFSHLRKSRPPPSILLSTPEQQTSKLDDPCQHQAHLPEPPVSATDSVISLPLLNLVRGVPFSHRVPLQVTNPDRMSIISEIDVLVMGSTSTSQPPSSTAVEATRDNGNTLSVPVVQRSSHKTANEDIKDSSSSIRSSDSRSSVSSRSSCHPEDNHTSSEEKDRKDEPPEFLIVFLGDKLDRDPTSWHGGRLEKQSSIRSLPADRHSPWISPLARPDSVHHQYLAKTTHESDSDESGDEGGWRNSPVIVTKPMVESMGLLPYPAYFRTPPMIPSIPYHSPAHQSPYLYSSPHLDSPSYLPVWSPPPLAASPPLSRAYSTPYASPYMHPHNIPF